jgi:hypothetical protein
LVDPEIDFLVYQCAASVERLAVRDYKVGDVQRPDFGKLNTKLIIELIDKVADFPIGIHGTQEIRLKLIEERSTYASDFRRGFEHLLFFLCEL